MAVISAVYEDHAMTTTPTKTAGSLNIYLLHWLGGDDPETSNVSVHSTRTGALAQARENLESIAGYPDEVVEAAVRELDENDCTEPIDGGDTWFDLEATYVNAGAVYLPTLAEQSELALGHVRAAVECLKAASCSDWYVTAHQASAALDEVAAAIEKHIGRAP